MMTTSPRRAARPAGTTHRLLVLGLVLLLAVLATMTPTSASARSAQRADLRDPFSREVVRPGDRDADPYHIEHVYEVQHRLQRVGLFDRAPTGYFGSVTTSAVEAFQTRNGLAPTGIVGPRTWRKLIRQSVRGRAVVPDGCKSAGWHACYDRRRHQVNLYHDGTMLNSWLVRGGGVGTPTRTGRFHVYYRDIDHVSGMFDTPMPYSQFFSGGQALHGSRLMMDPFVGHSHGCVNFWTEDARQLWRLTSTHRLYVRVYGRWD